MGGDPYNSNQRPPPGARTQTNDPSQGDTRGYEYYQSQVDPEELFRKIFGDAFNRGGFSNHEWMNDPNENNIGKQGVSQVFSSHRFFSHLIDFYSYS
jgi:hypothetical protein